MENPTGPFQLRHRLSILRTVRKLKADGTIKKGMDHDDIKEAIVAALIDSDPKTYADPSFDWMALIELIIQMLPVILALFGL